MSGPQTGRTSRGAFGGFVSTSPKGFNKKTDLFLKCWALPSSSTRGGLLL